MVNERESRDEVPDMCSMVRLSADPGSVAKKCAHSVRSSANPGSLTRKCTHLIEAADDDDIVVKWSGDGKIVTNLKPRDIIIIIPCRCNS